MKITKLWFVVVLFHSNLALSYSQPDKYLYKFDSLYRVGKFLDIINFTPPPNLDSMHSKSIFFIGMAFLSSNSPSNAVPYFEKAIEKGPTDGDMYYFLGLSYKDLGQYDKAIENIRIASNSLHDEADIYYELAKCFEKMGQEDSTLWYYAMTVKFPESPFDAYVKVPKLLAKKKDYYSAIRHYTRCAYAVPPKSEYHEECLLNLAYLEYLNEEYILAKEHFKELKESYPSNYDGICNYIKVAAATKNYALMDSLKQIIYTAKKEGLLPTHLQEMFPIDEFYAQGRKVLAYEEFDNAPGKKQNTYLYYVLDYKKDMIATIITKKIKNNLVYSIISSGKESDNKKLTFKDLTPYSEHKNAAIEMLKYCTTKE